MKQLIPSLMVLCFCLRAKGSSAESNLSRKAQLSAEIERGQDTKIAPSDLQLDMTGNGINDASFKIKNLAASDLIAFSVVLDTYWENDPTFARQLRVTEDSWFLRQYILHPGESRPVKMMNGIAPTAPNR